MDKKFKDLDLNNAFLFAAAMEDEETCRLILEIILDRKIPCIKVHAEHGIFISADYRSVRFDIFASDVVQVSYDMEMQNDSHHNLAKRSRLYQGQMDVASLSPGDDFDDLKPSYIIFICTFDPFGQGLYRYTFEEHCRECDMPLGDETYKIFLNTRGKNDSEVPAALVHFLKYVEKSTDEYVEQTGDYVLVKLHKKVSKLKRWRELEERYVTFEELLKERENEGEAKGLAKAVLDLLTDYGDVPETVSRRVLEEKDLVILSGWLRAAAKSSNLQQFRKDTNIL